MQNKIETVFASTNSALPLNVGIVCPESKEALEAVVEAAEAGVINPVLIGDIAKITTLAQKLHLSIASHVKISAASAEAAKIAIAEIEAGNIQALMKGSLPTDVFMDAIVRAPNLRTARRMSHVMLFDIPHYPKPLIISDIGLNITPNLIDKKDIIQNAIDFVRTIGLAETPKVALLSAVETVTDKIPNTLDCAALAKMAERGQIKNAIVDGPLAFDLALDKEAITCKQLISQVAGDPDILIVPNLETGNILGKALEYFAHANGYGIVVGAKIPLIVVSRAAKISERIGSCRLAQLYHLRHKKLN